MTRCMTRLLLTLTLVLTVASATRDAFGQGTFGSLPDPISSRDLERYADQLSLSDQQLLAIAEPHGQYLEDFRVLRDRDIQNLLDDVQVLVRNFDFSQRRQVEQAVRTLNRIMTQIRTLDERLFDEMQAVLTDDQAAQLPRVRMSRERSRYTSEMTRGVDFLNPAVRVDLSSILQGMNLSPDLLEQIDPTLEVYERRLTAASRKLFETTTNMILDTLKQLEQRGFTSGTPEDPRVAMELFQTFQEIWSEISADLLKEANDVASLQRSTYRSLAGLLPAEVVRDLQMQYYRRAYPEAASLGRRVMRQFDVAAELEDISEQQRDDIKAMAMNHWQNINRISEQIIDQLDDRRANFNLRNAIRRNEDERQEVIDDLRARAEAADEAALTLLHDTLGEELAAHVRTARGPRGGGPARRGPGRAPTQDGEFTDPYVGRVPSRISSADVSRYTAQLALDDGQQAVVESMHDDYLEQFAQLNEQHLTPLRHAARDMAAMAVSFGNVSEDDAQQLKEIFAMQQDAFDALRSLDEAFFDNVAAVIAPEQQTMLQRVRLSRERLAYTGGQHQPRATPWGGRGGGRWGNQSNESNIDLSLLIDQLQLQESLDDRASEALLEYERKATELFRDKYLAEFQVYQAVRTINPRENRRAFREAMADSGRVSAEMNRALAALNRESLEALRGTLPAESAHYLQHYYRQHAFPEVFDDPGKAEQMISSALELAELSESQRSRLRDLSLEYRASYARIADQMYQVHEAISGENEGNNRASREERMQSNNQLDRLRFEREEINEGARRQLRAILSEDQLQRISGL